MVEYRRTRDCHLPVDGGLRCRSLTTTTDSALRRVLGRWTCYRTGLGDICSAASRFDWRIHNLLCGCHGRRFMVNDIKSAIVIFWLSDCCGLLPHQPPGVCEAVIPCCG